MKRILALLIALTMMFGCVGAVAETVPTEETHKIEEKSIPFILFTGDEFPASLPLYFVDGAEDLPYVNLKDWADFMRIMFEDEPRYAGYKLTTEVGEERKIVTLLRENGHMMSVDFENSLILWDDYLGFQQGTITPYMDMSILSQIDDQGQSVYLKTVSNRDRHGVLTTLKLSDYYGVHIYAQDGLYLVPLQTLSAFTLSSLNIALYYNQNCLIISPVERMQNLKAQLPDILYANGFITEEMIAEAERKFPDSTEDMVNFYIEEAKKTEAGQAIIDQVEEQFKQSPYGLYAASSPKGNRSDALAFYGYGELCMELDFFYGLKSAHGIDDFDEFFIQIGSTANLMDPDPAKADQVIYDMTTYWLDDGHSAPISHSYLVDTNSNDDVNFGFSTKTREKLVRSIRAVRDEYPEAKLPYYEVGNTAYVSFDNFVMNPSIDYYAAAEKGELPDPAADNFSLVYYAHQQITRENSPIENVVLDLSMNGGGMYPSAIWVLCWFLGEAHVSYSHTATGAETTFVYRADVNFDHQFDEKDTISDLNLFCLTSPKSFSCGNLVPWAFKADGRVRLMGRVSGGGSCMVGYMTTAWGTSFQISSPNRLSFVKNGAYYDVDQGVEPDIFISNFHNFYDRKALTDIINGLN